MRKFVGNSAAEIKLMKTDIICKIDEFLHCPKSCENYEERDVCLILLRLKLAEGVK